MPVRSSGYAINSIFSGHADMFAICPLSGAKRTLAWRRAMSAPDPKADIGQIEIPQCSVLRRTVCAIVWGAGWVGSTHQIQNICPISFGHNNLRCLTGP